MFIDARTLPDQTLVEADLAIIGAGAAGITLACALLNRGLALCLIEAGGLEFDAATQALYDGENAGIAYPIAANRLRYFGGSTNHWGGYCRPLDPIDFMPRDWVPYSGWPFTIDELRPYYARASRLVETGEARFDDPAYWEAATGEPLPRPASDRIGLGFVQMSPPTRFGQRYRDRLAQATDLRVLLHANVVDIASTGQGASVTGLALQTLSGRRHRVRARRYVLATGGLENPRMLLLANSDVAPGLGNQHDLVGRYFMEHPHLSDFAEIVVDDFARLPRLCRKIVPVGDRNAGAAFVPSAAFQRHERLLNAAFMAGEASRYVRGAAAADERAQRHQAMLAAARPLLADTASAPGTLDDAPAGAWLGLGCACEQRPNPDSRVTLSKQRDALGLRQLRLAWRLTAEDRHSFVAHVRALAMEIGALGVGRMYIDIDSAQDWPPLVYGGAHHMGTTRMHDDPRQGVVDRDCRVHGTDNLFVAGSSVFPTGGAANPTLTIVALALRLAEQLDRELH